MALPENMLSRNYSTNVESDDSFQQRKSKEKNSYYFKFGNGAPDYNNNYSNMWSMK